MGKFRNLSKAIDGFTTLRNDVKHTDAMFAQRDRLIDMVSLFLPPSSLLLSLRDLTVFVLNSCAMQRRMEVRLMDKNYENYQMR